MLHRFGGTPRRSMVGSHLLLLADAVSLGVGLTAAWVTLGTESLYCIGSISFVGLLTVPLLRGSGVTTASYEWGLLSGVLVTCWMGLVIAFGVAGLVWVAVLLATILPVRTLWASTRPGAAGRGAARRAAVDRGAVAPAPRGGGAPTATRPTADTGMLAANVRRAVLAVPELDLDALCLVWRRSYRQLLDAGLTPTGAAVVNYRQRILDEIDQRDPGGLSRWLASGPRAAGNPLPYLHPAADPPALPGARPPKPHESHDEDTP